MAFCGFRWSGQVESENDEVPSECSGEEHEHPVHPRHQLSPTNLNSTMTMTRMMKMASRTSINP